MLLIFYYVCLYMLEKKYENIRSAILHKLGAELAATLTYHCVEHTIDVEQSAIAIATAEGITNEEDLFLLKTACLYHDTGFLFTYHDHEAASCDLVKNDLTPFGITPSQIDIICGMIMATQLPQTPLTKLEEIIADADLDYLGRADFFDIGNTLFEEWKAWDFVSSEYQWNLIQIKFFKQHHYFTATSQRLRDQQKQTHLEMIEAANELL